MILKNLEVLFCLDRLYYTDVTPFERIRYLQVSL